MVSPIVSSDSRLCVCIFMFLNTQNNTFTASCKHKMYAPFSDEPTPQCNIPWEIIRETMATTIATASEWTGCWWTVKRYHLHGWRDEKLWKDLKTKWLRERERRRRQHACMHSAKKRISKHTVRGGDGRWEGIEGKKSTQHAILSHFARQTPASYFDGDSCRLHSVLQCACISAPLTFPIHRPPHYWEYSFVYCFVSHMEL